MYIPFDNNPVGRKVEDCSVRAVSVALNLDWETSFLKLAMASLDMGDMPSSDTVLAAVLRKHGFNRYSIPNTCPNCYTVYQFSKDHPRGIFVLASGKHVTTVKNGDIYDSWDSSMEIPQYYWTNEY